MNTQCFELRWRSTIVTSQDDYGEVPYVRVTKVRDMTSTVLEDLLLNALIMCVGEVKLLRLKTTTVRFRVCAL